MKTKSQQILRQIPNSLSLLRIVCTLGLIFVEPMRLPFFILYSICGLTDVLDGFIARRFHCTSELGAVLDSVADLCFYAMMILRLFPILWEIMDRWIWLFGLSAVAVRLIAYSVAAWKYKRFSSIHTYMNKATGLTVFAVPYFTAWIGANLICTLACAVGFLASSEELVLHLTSHRYSENRKSIFMKAE